MGGAHEGAALNLQSELQPQHFAHRVEPGRLLFQPCCRAERSPRQRVPALGTMDKLKREPVEDYRIDFEDGYGNRPDAEEDGHAVSTAQAVARGAASPRFPAFLGIRIKPFTQALRKRSMRTLDVFMAALRASSGFMPAAWS